MPKDKCWNCASEHMAIDATMNTLYLPNADVSTATSVNIVYFCVDCGTRGDIPSTINLEPILDAYEGALNVCIKQASK